MLFCWMDAIFNYCLLCKGLLCKFNLIISSVESAGMVGSQKKNPLVDEGIMTFSSQKKTPLVDEETGMYKKHVPFNYLIDF